MLDVGKLTSYMGGKYFLSDIKKEKEDITHKSIILKHFNKEYLGKDKYYKVYYDTPDFLFRRVGINICKTNVIGSKSGEIVVRYDSERERINFLQYMPDTYTLTVPAKDSIISYADFIAKAITELITNGLQTNMLDLVRTIIPIIIVNKKRERFQLTSSSGLKLTFSFDNVIYTSPKTKDKEKLDVLDVVSKSPRTYAEEYNKTMNALVIENPTIVKTHHSDLFIGLDYLLNMKS